MPSRQSNKLTCIVVEVFLLPHEVYTENRAMMAFKYEFFIVETFRERFNVFEE